MEAKNIPEFRVKKDTDVKNLSAAIFANIKNVDKIELKCIGVPAVNQAVKAVITARGLATPAGFDIVIKPYFDILSIQGEEKTAVGMILEKI
jgi:stage V sporulation protein SpoVS